MLILFARRTARDYFETLDAMAPGQQLSDDEKAEFFLRHDTFWV